MKKKRPIIRALILMLGLTILFQTTYPLRVQAASTGARILLESYEIVDGQAAAGQQITLRLTFENSSPNASASGVLITYGTNNSGIVPVYGNSNQIYIPSLGPQESYTAQIECQVLNQQSYSTALIYFSASYQDGASFSTYNDFMIAVPLVDQIQLQIENLTLPAEFQAQTQSAGHLTIRNTGKYTAYNVVVHCSGPLPEGQQNISLGELPGGDSISADLSLTLSQEGEQKLSFWLEYQDQNGTWAETEPVVNTVFVSPAENPQNTLPAAQASPEQDTAILLWISALGCVFLLGVLIYRHMKRKNKFVD